MAWQAGVRFTLERGSPLRGDKDGSVYNLDTAWALACQRLTEGDIKEHCRRSGAEYQGQDSETLVTIRYLNQSYQINLPDIKVSPVGDAEDLPLRERILLLHYLTLAKGTPPANKLITYRDLPGGIVYYPTFSKRTVEPLSRHFGKDPALLSKASQRLGARKADLGDAAVVIDAFERVPITIVLWEGDDELPPQLNLLFDASITDYLESEDVTILCETLTWRLIRYSPEA